METAYAGVDDLAGAYRSGKLSPVEIVETFLSRINRFDSLLAAYITVTAERARQQAGRAEHDLRTGTVRGPLHGIPFAVKDILLTDGIPTTAGSRVLRHWVPRTTASVIRRLEDGGAILLGKLNMAEFALGNPIEFPFGVPRNPWNPAHETGGSSNGCGVALAAGLTTLAIGTDTVGSVRVPAAYCGVVGFHPTWGLTETDGLLPVAKELDVIGPMARSVGDVAHLLDVMAAPAARNAAGGTNSYAAGLNRSVRGMKAGIVVELAHNPAIDSDVRQAVDDAIAVLRGLGVVTQEVSIPLVAEAGSVYAALGIAEAAAVHWPALRSVPHEYGREARLRLATGLLIPSAISEWARDIGWPAIRQEVLDAMAGCEVLLAPTMPTAAPRIEAENAGPAQGARDPFDINRPYIIPFAFAGMPALSLCCGFTRRKLPVALQIAGRPHEDGLVLRVGHAYEAATDWHRAHPPAPPV